MSAVLKVTQAELDRLGYVAEQELDRQYAGDPWRWLCDQVVTIDEATQEQRSWPDKPYLHDVIDALQSNEKKIGIPKSRRMMVSWVVAAWCVHRARYFPNNAIFWQSQNEQKAAYVVDKRCAYIEDNLVTKALRRPYQSIHTHGGLIGKMEYELQPGELGAKSYIWAVPEGDAVFRAYTPSVVVIDESDFMERGHESLAAVIPMAEKATKLIVISTSNGPRGVLAQICKEANLVRFR